jgi:tripartite-type tricarboxylate transporter receptor subunit TctC
MEIDRRRLLVLAAGTAVGAAGPRVAQAEGYPSRPVHWIVGFAPGGSTDILARVIGQYLSEKLGQAFIIENRPGAGSNIATEVVFNAPPDGYTLLMISPAHAVNATLYEKLSFNFLRDIAPVAGISREANVMVVSPSFPATSVPAFIAFAKTNPGKVNMASSGVGTSVHVAGELFNMMAGLKMTHVPYRGAGPAITDILGGQVQVMFAAMPSAFEHVKAGRLRALAVTTAARLPTLPDVPAVGEFLPGYEASSWYGIGAPRATPPQIIDTLNRAMNTGLADARLKVRLGELGGTMLAGSPAEFGRLIADETEKWAKVVKFSGARPG